MTELNERNDRTQRKEWQNSTKGMTELNERNDRTERKEW